MRRCPTSHISFLTSHLRLDCTVLVALAKESHLIPYSYPAPISNILFPVFLAKWLHPIPSRTRPLSTSAPMIVPASAGAKVGKCREQCVCKFGVRRAQKFPPKADKKPFSPNGILVLGLGESRTPPGLCNLYLRKPVSRLVFCLKL